MNACSELEGEPYPKMLESDRLVADVFGLPHRVYRLWKASSYRWQALAPASMKWISEAATQHWSIEKTAEWLDGTLEEAAACLRRYQMAESVNQGVSGGERIRLQIAEWLKRFDGLTENERANLARELGHSLANELDRVAEAGGDLKQIAVELEPDQSLLDPDGPIQPLDHWKKAEDVPTKKEFPPFPKQGDGTEPERGSWGPQWKG